MSEWSTVPLTLSHRMLGQIVGARRPTVTAAVRTLIESGDVVRRPDGSWLLTGEDRQHSPSDDEHERAVAPRRRMIIACGPECSLLDGAGAEAS